MSVILNSPTVVIGHMSGGTININNGTASSNDQRQTTNDHVEDITPAQEDQPEPIDSIIFTKKAKKESKEACIIEALKKSVHGRKDKTRAFVQELHSWQKDGYVDAHYNAKVMYDELEKMLPLTFGYETFKKYYNNTI